MANINRLEFIMNLLISASICLYCNLLQTSVDGLTSAQLLQPITKERGRK